MVPRPARRFPLRVERGPELVGVLAPLAWSGAFWVALAQVRDRDRVRMAAGLGLGAAAAHLGWFLLHADALAAHPYAWLDPRLGYCVLLLPLGPWLAAPRASPQARRTFLAAAFGALPLAIAVARLGCLAAGCCRAPLHPTPAYEIAGLLLLDRAVRWPSAARRPGAVLLGLGLLRLALEPLRAPPPLGPPVVSPGWLALGLAGLGVLGLRGVGPTGGAEPQLKIGVNPAQNP